jgi:hypothetical protein
MNGEMEFAYRVRRVLNGGTEQLDRKVADRLGAARQAAVARQQALAGEVRLAGVGGSVIETVAANIRPLLAGMALILGVTFAYYWNKYDQAVGYAEIDSEILADEVPFNAYLDQGFQEWLNRRAQEPDEGSSPASSPSSQ